MPELPEVETIRRGLQEYVVGYRVVDVEVGRKEIVRGDIHNVVGGKIVGVRRYGKGLVVDLDNGWSLAVHVKMTGQLLFRGSNPPIPFSKGGNKLYPNKWTHVVFVLRSTKHELRITEDAYLYYADVRRFGWIEVVRREEVERLPFFASLGPEPFKDLSLDLFRSVVSKSRVGIKVLLMDQRRVAGIGNIYANEALFLARIHPGRRASSLVSSEVERLFSAMEEVLRRSIEMGGTSASNYVNVLGERGRYQEEFLVYKKDGEECGRCGGIIERVVVGGRGTFFCSGCQG